MANFYKVRKEIIIGTDYKEVSKKAFHIFEIISKKGKRRPYVRSKYFNGQKIFISIFWSHLREKRLGDKMRRLKFYDCALELIKRSTNKPDKVFEKTKGYYLYRFYGKSNTGKRFVVQVKESKRSKHLISVFPLGK